MIMTDCETLPELRSYHALFRAPSGPCLVVWLSFGSHSTLEAYFTSVMSAQLDHTGDRQKLDECTDTHEQVKNQGHKQTRKRLERQRIAR
jgi:hypothetical protein